MVSYVYLAGLSFVVCFLTTPLVRDWTRKLGLLDHPDRPRKIHETPVPRLGGIAIAFAWIVSLGTFVWWAPEESEVFVSALKAVWPLLPAAVLLFVIGVVDDLFELRPWQKLSGQIVAATWIYVQGLRIETLAGTDLIGSHWVTFPLTLIWLLACTNAFNLIDGVDGLASGVGFFATVTMFLAALLQGNAELQLLTLPLATALLAFLRYNFNPASIFLGDSGSLLLGFLLGSFGIIWSQKSATILGMTAPVLALGFPIAETVISIVRRFLRGDPIFAADQGHIHHRLLEKGLRPRQVAVVLYAATGLFAAVSLIMAQPEIRDRAVILIAFCVISWIGFQNLGYTEFVSARRILLGGTVRRLVASDIQVRQFIAALAEADTLEKAWEQLANAARDLEFVNVKLEIPESELTLPLTWERSLVSDELAGQQSEWSLQVRLPESDATITLEHGPLSGDADHAMRPIVSALREVLPRLIEEYEFRQVVDSPRKAARAASA